MSPVEVAWPSMPNRTADCASPGTALLIVLAVRLSSLSLLFFDSSRSSASRIGPWSSFVST